MIIFSSLAQILSHWIHPIFQPFGPLFVMEIHQACVYAVPSGKSFLFKVQAQYSFRETFTSACKETDTHLPVCLVPVYVLCLHSHISLELAVSEPARSHNCKLHIAVMLVTSVPGTALDVVQVSTVHRCKHTGHIISANSELKALLAHRCTILSPPHLPCTVSFGG